MRATDLLRANLDPPTSLRPASGPDLKGVGGEALDILKLAMAGVTFTEDRLSATLADAPSVEQGQ